MLSFEHYKRQSFFSVDVGQMSSRNYYRFVQDYSNAERMLAATGFAPLMVNLKSMTTKPNVGGDSKNCVAWKVQKAVHYVVHTGKVSKESPVG